MEAVKQYLQAKLALIEAQEFAALLDAPHNSKIADIAFVCTLDPKTSNTNAVMPRSMRAFVEVEARRKADNIIRDAVTAMQAELVTIAEAARQEYAQIAADAGVTLP